MVEHRLNPALAVKKIEADLAAKEFGDEQVTLPLEILNDASVHLRQELIKRGLIIAALLDHIESCCRDLTVVDGSMVCQER